MKRHSSMLHVRVDTELKHWATAALSAMGPTASEAAWLHFHRIAVDQAIPLELKVPNAQTRRALAGSGGMTGQGTTRFASTDEAFAELEGSAARQADRTATARGLRNSSEVPSDGTGAERKVTRIPVSLSGLLSLAHAALGLPPGRLDPARPAHARPVFPVKTVAAPSRPARNHPQCPLGGRSSRPCQMFDTRLWAWLYKKNQPVSHLLHPSSH